jgi:hypothetical protein
VIAEQLQAALNEAKEAVDRLYRQEALDFWKLLNNYVKKNADTLHLKPKQKQFQGLVLSPKDLGTKRTYPDLHLVLAPSSYSAGVGHPQTGGRAIVMVLPVLIGPYDTKHIATRMWGRRSDFIHEFIHYLDEHRYKGKVTPSAKLLKQRGTSAYYNSPSEFNAFYQAGAHETLNTLRNVATQAEPIQRGTLARFLKDFKTFEKRVGHNQAFFDQGFVEGLNEKYRRKFLQRLHGLYVEIVKELGTG